MKFIHVLGMALVHPAVSVGFLATVCFAALPYHGPAQMGCFT